MLHVKLPPFLSEKILLLTRANFRGDYPPFVSPIRATVSGQNPQTSLSIRTGLGKNESDNTYFIELPPFLLNGVKHQLSPIKLERKSFGVGIDPFNC